MLLKPMVFGLLFLSLCLGETLARAERVTFEQARSALEEALNLRQEQLHMRRGETQALRDRLAKNPPGPGWADFGWSDDPVAGNSDWLLLLLNSARDFGLLGREDIPSRLILNSIAHRYERAAQRIQLETDKPSPYMKALVAMPEYARFMEFDTRQNQANKTAWLLTAAYLKQECGAQGLEPDSWKQSMTETAPEFRRFKQGMEQLRLEANKMAKSYGPRITRNWPGALAFLLEDVRTRADLCSMALVTDISKDASKEALKTLGFLFRMHEDGYARFKVFFSEAPEDGIALSEPEKRFAREAVRRVNTFDVLDMKKLVPVVNEAEELLEARQTRRTY